jgi:hypothetical protein
MYASHVSGIESVENIYVLEKQNTIHTVFTLCVQFIMNPLGCSAVLSLPFLTLACFLTKHLNMLSIVKLSLI